MRIPRYVPALLFIAAAGVVVAWMILEARGFNQSARTVPLVVGVPTLAFIVIQFLRDGLRVARGDAGVGDASEEEQDRYMQAAMGQVSQPDTGEGGAGAGDTVVSGAGAGGARADAAEVPHASLPGAALWVASLALLIWLVGLLAAIPVFIVAFMRVFGRERWRTIAAFALGTAAAVYLFFAVVLEIRLYEGLFGDLLPWP